jgi:hypothetical protein
MKSWKGEVKGFFFFSSAPPPAANPALGGVLRITLLLARIISFLFYFSFKGNRIQKIRRTGKYNLN